MDIISRGRANENYAWSVSFIVDSCYSDSSLWFSLLQIVTIVGCPAYSLTIIKCAGEHCGKGSVHSHGMQILQSAPIESIQVMDLFVDLQIDSLMNIYRSGAEAFLDRVGDRDSYWFDGTLRGPPA
jgi:hypothetical protein